MTTEATADPTPTETAEIPAVEAPSPPKAKAQVFQDDVRNSIVARHREHRLANDDPSLGAARSESLRQAQANDSNEGADGTAGAGGSAGVGGGAPSASSGDPDRMVTVKVYGEEYDVPEAVVNAHGGKDSFQKVAAAEVQLRQAAEANKRAQRAANELEALTKQATLPAASASSAKPGLPSGDSGNASMTFKDEGRELLDAMLDSNPDRVAAALEKVLSKGRAAAPTPAAAPVATSGSERTLVEIATANAVFETEFAELRGNEQVMPLARELMRSRMADPSLSGVSLPEIARDIGKQFGFAAPVASQGTVNDRRAEVEKTMELRTNAKRQAPSARTASQLQGSQPPPPPEPTRDQKHSLYVNTLRSRSGSNSTAQERRATQQR